MTALLQAVGHAQKLNEIHEVISRLYGDKFQERVSEYEPVLREVAKRHDGNLIGAATELCKPADMDAREQLLILAVAVELTKREAK